MRISFILVFCVTLNMFADNTYSQNAVENDASTNAVTQQTISVSGTVTDDTGDALPGVTVLIKGTGLGTTTDVNGKFTLNVPSSQSVLQLSYIGYTAQEITVGSTRTFNVKMREDDQLLDEVIVIGYGVQKKSDVTGAISSIRSQDLENRSTSDALAAIQGKAAGVQIMNTSGKPGEAASIRIRGYSSNQGGSTSPLYVVDGLIVDNLQYLDPQMIESMEILKDAASAAIYGAQAGNGVVLITTKRAKPGDGRLFYNYQLINNRLGNIPKRLNAEEYIQYKKEENGSNYSLNGYDTDWVKELFEPSNTNSHTIGFQGANDRGNLFLSINNVDNQGMVKGPYDFYKRLTVQLNTEYKIKSWLTVGSTQSIEKWERVSLGDRSDWGSSVMSALRTSPLVPLYYDTYEDLPQFLKTAVDGGRNVLKDPDNGKYYGVQQVGNHASPFIQRDRGKNDNQQGFGIRGTFYLNLSPIKDLVFTSRFGYRLSQGFNKNFTTPYYANSASYTNDYSLSVSSSNGWYYQWENFANYNKKIKKHDLGLMLGMSYVQNEGRGVNTTISGLDPLNGYDPNFIYVGQANASATRTSGETNNSSSNMAYFGRITYGFDNRYNLTANLRADAYDSSKLSEKVRWGYFPSISVGWTISNEAFMTDLARNIKMDHMKLRLSYGKNGNIAALGSYQYDATISAGGGNFYQFGAGNPVVTQGRKPNRLVNKDLKWETLIQSGIGLDLRFFKNRLTFTYDYFNKTTDGLLLAINPFAEVGITATTSYNYGKVHNSGHEFEFGWKDRKGDFSYSINGNLSFLKNEVRELHASVNRLTASRPMNSMDSEPAFEAGFPVWYVRGYEFDRVAKEPGYYKDSEGNQGQAYKAGEALFTDINGDGRINNMDLTKIASGVPKATYGLTVNLGYKNVDMSILGSGVTGNTIWMYYYDAGATTYDNLLHYYYEDRWTPENPNGTKPVFNDDSKKRWLSSSANVFKGDFFKIKQIQIGYNVPKKLLSKVFVNNLRVYTSFDEFFTFTKYPGFDPEASPRSTSDGLAIDVGNFPLSKRITFGLNISF